MQVYVVYGQSYITWRKIHNGGQHGGQTIFVLVSSSCKCFYGIPYPCKYMSRQHTAIAGLRRVHAECEEISTMAGNMSVKLFSFLAFQSFRVFQSFQSFFQSFQSFPEFHASSVFFTHEDIWADTAIARCRWARKCQRHVQAEI